jgi:hypothetical protein
VRTIRSDEIKQISEWKPKDMSQYVEDFAALQKKLGIESAAMARLQSQIYEHEITTEMGEQNNEAAPNFIGVSLPFLLQLNITRFGTLTLVGIGIGILVPLYRFSARLSTFYRALADALRFRQSIEKRVSFVRLATALSPRLDFGKSQVAIDHSLVALARETSEQVNRKRGDAETEN